VHAKTLNNMRFSIVVSTWLSISLLVNAIPIHEFGVEWGELAARADAAGVPPATGTVAGSSVGPAKSSTQTQGDESEAEEVKEEVGKISTGRKGITLGGKKYLAAKYPMSPDLSKRKNANVANILEKYKGLHGIWLGVAGSVEVEKKGDAGEEAIESR